MNILTHLLGATERFGSSGRFSVFCVLAGVWFVLWLLGKLLPSKGGPGDAAKKSRR